MPALCKGIIMAIFHHASVCPVHFPFNEKLFLFLFCYNRSVDSDCRRILGLQGYRVNLFHIEYFPSRYCEIEFTKKDLFLRSLYGNKYSRKKSSFKNRSSYGLLENSFRDYWEVSVKRLKIGGKITVNSGKENVNSVTLRRSNSRNVRQIEKSRGE